MRALGRSIRAGGPPVAIGLGFALLAGLVASWFVPVLAIGVVWPLFYVVPGLLLLAWTRAPGDPPTRIGLAIVLSVAVSTHLVWWLALVSGGYSRLTVFGVALAVGGAWVAHLALAGGRTPAGHGISGRRAGTLARGHAGVLVVASAAALVVGGTLAASLWRVQPEGVWTGGSNWSDLSVHLSIAQSVNAGNFPPQVPFFAGAPLVYHWFADFHGAITARAAGLFAIPAMVVQSTILSAALALVVYGLARRLVRGPRSRRVAVLAALLAVFAGGMGWTRLVGDVVNGIGDPVELVARNSYDNQWWDARGIATWPYFRIPSVMGTGLLVHRATTAGLPMLVGALLLLVAGLPPRPRSSPADAGVRDRPRVILLAGLLGALLAPFHFFFFPAFLVLALLWVIAGDRLIDRSAPRNALLVLAPLAASLPFALPALDRAASGNATRLVIWWESAPTVDGPLAVAFFYVSNLGLALLLAAAALFVTGTRAKLFLAAWALVLFAVPNLVQVSAVAFDMNKYFQAMSIALAMLAAQLLARWPLTVVAAALLLAVPSPLLAAAWTLTSQNQLLTTDELAASRWVAANTPADSVFVTNGHVNSLTDAAGRLRLTSFGWYVRNLGYDPTEREAAVAGVYCAPDSRSAAERMVAAGAEYVVDTYGIGACGPVNFATGGGLREVHRVGNVAIWQLGSPGSARTGATAEGAGGGP